MPKHTSIFLVLFSDYPHPRNLKKAQVAELAQTDWLERGQNLLITGPCGSGKTNLGCAVGHQACLNGLSQLANVELLILDWGMEALKPAQRNDLPRWIYQQVGCSQIQFHYPGKTADSEHFKYTQNLENAGNWVRAESNTFSFSAISQLL